ncbi:phage major capsid protein, P2 family [uncultured Xylophilus sp.]|uniref:phage major capsid protein, P2 family n=1 Tax=uncultured Xylophilus sp. TaxID=296832 RepID=UPI0025E6EF30|nr:phage major capsid protein, P2 family [uncultured Xylophilus sp.]
MKNPTRLAFNAWIERQQQLNSVPSARESFSVAPTVQQTLETRIQESSELLRSINVIGVAEKQGQKLGLGVSGPIASRTNTDTTDRVPRAVDAMNATDYDCKQTNYDTFVRYGTLDAWAKFKDFQARLRDVIVQRQALDRLVIGFNGTSAAATTNLGANPLLQDVNIGWLQHIRTDAPTRVMNDGGAAGVGPIKVGPAAGADYKNLDGLVYDAAQTLIDPWFRNDTKLVAIVGGNLMHDKLFPLVGAQNAPSEQLAADIVRSQRRLGGLQAITAPYFPAGTVLVTRLDNLSIYWQEGARRRTIVDNAKRDRIENYESSNDAYVVEDYGMCALIENIELVD